MKKFKKAMKIAGNILVWLFVAFAVVMTTFALAAQNNADGVPALGGNCFLTVSSDSMSPTFRKGDLLVGKMLTGTEKTELNEGDVISFYADLDGNGTEEINTHRIVRINYDSDGEVESYVTQGDNKQTNQVEDKDPVKWQYVISRWDGTRVVGVGGFISFLQRPTGFLVLIVLPLVLLFIYQIFVFIKTLISVKNTGKRQITAADEELIKQRAIEEYLRSQQAEQQNAEPTPEKAEPTSETAEAKTPSQNNSSEEAPKESTPQEKAPLEKAPNEEASKEEASIEEVSSRDAE